MLDMGCDPYQVETALVAGEGKALFATTDHRRALELRKAQQLPDGRMSLIYEMA